MKGASGALGKDSLVLPARWVAGVTPCVGRSGAENECLGCGAVSRLSPHARVACGHIAALSWWVAGRVDAVMAYLIP